MAGKKEKVKTFKLDEDLGKQINVLAKKSGRTIAAQIRELVRLGIEKEKEEGEKESEKPPYPPEDLETLIDRKIEEKFAHYTNAKDGRLAGEPPDRIGHPPPIRRQSAQGGPPHKYFVKHGAVLILQPKTSAPNAHAPLMPPGQIIALASIARRRSMWVAASAWEWLEYLAAGGLRL